MEPAAPDLDALPPEARFAVRALAAGLGPDAIDALLRTEGPASRSALRTAARRFAGAPPVRGAGDEALLAALGPALAAAASPPRRVPGTACPGAEILRDLAAVRLDGPLLLATAEHAADCPPCMTALVAAHRAGPAAADAPPPRRGGAVGMATRLALVVAAGVLFWIVWRALR